MTYRDLTVYRQSYQYALEIHNFTLGLPQYLRYDLADQLRRSTRSIPSNIAEGYGRGQSRIDIQRFLRISLGSTDETLFNLLFLLDLMLIEYGKYSRFQEIYNGIGKQLYKLIRSLNY